MKKYVMALDQGTTSCRCILFDRAGTPVSVAQQEFAQYYPKPGWVEHDASEILCVQLSVARDALARAKADASQIAAIGITNQRETTVVWDRRTGKPLCPAIVWQCRRTADYCEELKARGLSPLFFKKTGLPIDAYFSGTKLRYLLDTVPGARRRAEAGELLFGTIDSWLIWNLTNGAAHVTDYSNASRTLLFNIHTLDWDDELLQLLDIPRAMLPTPVPSSGEMGVCELFGAPIPISGAAGDQQSALFGQTCFAPGTAKNTYGTGCFMLMNVGEMPVASQHGLISTVAWGEGGRVNYALEGSIFVAGAVIQWLRDELKILGNAPESESLAAQIADTGGVYFVPAFVGLGAPYWDPYARGALFGLTRGTGRAQIVRAALESMAYQTLDVLFAMQEDSGVTLSALRVDGGASANNFLMQFQSDIINACVERPACIETTALGAAYLAGLAVGYWENKEDVVKNRRVERIFTPQMTPDSRSSLIAGWHDAVMRSRSRIV